VPGIKSSAVRLGTDPGNTQGVLEVVWKSAGPVKVTMDEAEHVFVGSFVRIIYRLSAYTFKGVRAV
jgi:hypothetical protein